VPRAATNAAILFLLVAALASHAGDILRGGAPMGATKSRTSTGSTAGSSTANALQTNARDRLARTTAALDSVKALQQAARNNANARVTIGGTKLPVVPDGLRPGGLQVDPRVPKNLNKPKAGDDASLWIGAKLPTQTSAGGGAKNVVIVQTDQQAILNWKTFNVGKKTTLTFDQSKGGSDASKWIAFNKVNDPKARPSQILGQIKAQGQVYILNQNGIIFGNNSQVNVHTLTASALPINDALVSAGLLNNTDAQFLFDAVRVQTFDLTNSPKVLANAADSRDKPRVTYVDADDKERTLTADRDYKLTVDASGKTTISLTDVGNTKLATAKSDSALTVNYVVPHGDVTVQAGAQLSAPTSAAKTGGRIMLVGSKVKNSGTISTPDGQTILAAGLQVGIASHSSDDPSLRGLDVYVGAVAVPGSKSKPQAGTAINNGLIEVPRANATITGRSVQQNGVIDSSTTVSLNGRIDLDATYDAVANPAYDANGATDAFKVLFIPKSSGYVTLGEGSVTRILPELSSTETATGDSVAIRSQINARGQSVHMDKDASLLAPNAKVTFNAGAWNYIASSSASLPPTSEFVHSLGQIYIEQGALLDVSGTTDALAPLSENILTLELRGSELADSPLQRDGPFRGTSITIDARLTGTFNGKDWVGTPLGDASGFLDLVPRSLAELTTAGGSVDLQAGDSVVLNRGATVDVSGGWLRNEGGMVQTTKVVQGSRLIDIADATPDQVYDGIYDPKFTQRHSKWGVTKTYRNPLDLNGAHYESSYIQGTEGGSINIVASSMALDGKLTGQTVIGPKQERKNAVTSTLPDASKLALTFRSDDPDPRYGEPYTPISHHAPEVIFGENNLPAAFAFGIDEVGNPLVTSETLDPVNPYVLRTKRRDEVILSPTLLTDDGFGSLTVDNAAGDITVPESVALTAPEEGSITLEGRNINVQGSITAPGGALSFTANNISPYLVDQYKSRDTSVASKPLYANPDAGQFTLGTGAVLSTAGLTIDERNDASLSPIVTDGGKINITAYTANLTEGSLVDVSGGLLVDANSDIVSYGDAGSISVLAGKDPNLGALFVKPRKKDKSPDLLLGGRLWLNGELRGYSGAKGGSLALQAPFIQVGGEDSVINAPGTLHLQPEFFDRGGFASFDLTGIGGARVTGDGAVRTRPGLVIAADTVIEPHVTSLFANATNGGLEVTKTVQPRGLREPASLGFHSLGLSDDAQNVPGNIGIVFRGDTVMQDGAVIRTDPQANVAFSGSTVSIEGSVFAPAGTISVKGSNDSVGVFKQDVSNAVAMPTVYLGSHSQLSAVGTRVMVPDNYGHRIGTVLDGGTISVAGNIVAAKGSVLDVSGASGMLDFPPLALDPTASRVVSVQSGITAPLQNLQMIPVRVDSDGGTITLTGGDQLFTDATLLGRAGGSTAVGGTLNVSSGRFSVTGALPTDTNLIVTQSTGALPVEPLPSIAGPGEQSAIGHPVVDADGNRLPALGRFAADSFLDGGFDSLSLGGVVRFKGPVSIDARGSLKVATGGVLYADDQVDLSAPYVALGMAFTTPLGPNDPKSPFTAPTNPYNFGPTHGPGVLTVEADLIDIGTLSLRNMRFANFIARDGDIRGDGTLNIAGRLRFEAGQIYTPTALSFTAVAYDYQNRDAKPGAPLKHGSVVIKSSGSRQLPLSAGGTLSFYATDIEQSGVLRAPMGTINLGWNGTGTAPVDLIVGGRRALPITSKLLLGSGSITSVSAIDPAMGEGLLIPYGVSLDGNSWIDPTGTDVTAGGLPTKNINLSANRVVTKSGSDIDLRGGGDLYAYRWVGGLGGTTDILASETSFAVIPGYEANYAPVGAYNNNATLTAFNSDPLDASTRDAGYVNKTLSVGDRVVLGGSAALPSGVYTLLPARYALLPGAVLVTPKSGATVGTLSLPGDVNLVSGYRFNSLDSQRAAPQVYSQFEVVSQDVVRTRAQYDDFTANRFLRDSALASNTKPQTLPIDSGHLVFQATQTMRLNGSVLGEAPFGGRGAFIDVSSPADIIIAGADTNLSKKQTKGAIVLDAAKLSDWGAESLLIGGIRTPGDNGTKVTVDTGSLTVKNAGSPLSAPEIILVANDTLTLAPRAEIEQSSSLTDHADNLLLDGDGTLFRVSSDLDATFARTNVTSSQVPKMTIGAGASITGTSVTLDSTYATSLSPKALLHGRAVNLSSGQISLVLDDPGQLQATDGLVLAGRALRSLRSAEALSLLSYSSIDIYGSGEVGTRELEDLGLHAGEIRGFNNADGVRFLAHHLVLDNSANGKSPGEVAGATGGLRFRADTIELGNHRLQIDQFANVDLYASGGVLIGGKGKLLVDGDLDIRTPAFFAEGGATEAIRATGAMKVLDSGTTASPDLASGVGASLTLEGSSVTANSDILLPSGQLTLHATSGDVNVNGRLVVDGTAQVFNDLTKYTSGGEINLSSDGGDVNLARKGVLSVAAQKGGGSAGSLTISVPKGDVSLAGTLLGKGGAKGDNGTFSLDVGSLPELAKLSAKLDDASFDESRNFRVRNGDVLVNGTATSHEFRLSTDAGSILVTGKIDASGATGGVISLGASGSLTLADGSVLDASGKDFSHAGKGGAVTLAAGSEINGAIDPSAQLNILAGSKIDLSVAAANAGSESLGQFTGTLHLRAPQNAAGTDLQIGTVAGKIVDASNVSIEGYRLWDLTLVNGVLSTTGANTQVGGGQVIDSTVNVLQSVKLASAAFGANSDAIKSRILSGDYASLGDRAVVTPGVEIINQASAAPVTFTLGASGSSSVTVPATGGTILFPQGTSGGNQIVSTRAGSIITRDGSVLTLAANTPVSIPAGAMIVLSQTGTVSFAAGGTGGSIAVQLSPGSTFTSSTANSSGVVSGRGSSVALSTPGNSGIALDSGASVLFSTGTPGTRQIVSSVAGTIVTANGTTIALAANTPTSIAAGSVVTLSAAGQISYAGTGSGTGAPLVTLLSGSLTTSGVVAITPASGDLTLGTSTATAAAGDWDLSSFRFGPQNAPGVLTLRAGGNLTFLNTLSDGFTSSQYTAGLLDASATLPMNLQSWSYHLTAGADLGAADYRRVVPIAQLASTSGSLQLGRNNLKNQSNSNGASNASGSDATTEGSVVGNGSGAQNRYQVIRTGSGDIDISAGRDVQLLNQFATVYTAGTKINDPTLGGTFDLPYVSLSEQGDTLGAVQQDPAYPVQFSLGGGDVRLHAQGSIAHLTRLTSTGPLVADSEHQLPVNWLYRRGFVDPTTGAFGTTPSRLPLSGGTVLVGGDVTSTAWWVDFSNFFEGVGALGGGDVSLIADGNISNVDAVVPTNARLPKTATRADQLVEVGGGDLVVKAGNNIDAGVYYVERGTGVLNAGNEITTNATRSPSVAAFKTLAATSTPAEQAWLPTTLFLGKGSFDVSARGDLLLGPVANVFLLPEGLNNSIWYKTYFSTYAASSSVDVSSLGGSVTLRTRAALPGSGTTTSLLQAWLKTQLLLGTSSAPTGSFYQPWLRINETSVDAFPTAASLLPPILRATAFSGDLNLVGTFELSPSPRGTVEFDAGGAINGLQPTGGIIANDQPLVTWGTTLINVSDADPAAIPGVINPYAYRAFIGPAADKAGTARETDPGYLAFLDQLFAETGALNSVMQTKQTLHAQGLLHADDPTPLRLYAATGDISGITLFSPKATRIIAGQDITDNTFYIQNLSADDISIVSAGRDLIAYNASSPLRTLSQAAGNQPPGTAKNPELPLAGDIQVSGPGSIEVFAGGNLDLGTGATNADGTASGLVTVGNARNPYLPFDGAGIIAAAGTGPANGLSGSALDFETFINTFILGDSGEKYLAEIDPKLTLADFAKLPEEHRDAIALDAFYLVLRDAGRAHTADLSGGTSSYDVGYAAIAALFPTVKTQDGKPVQGDITTRSRDIRTKNGGSIDLLIPHGELTLASSTIGNPLVPPGIITETGGNISIFADRDVDIGIGRIFTLRGGNEIIWSSTGNIAAGAAAKTVKSAPPTRVLIDPQSADVQTDLAGLSTGGGIGVLATVEGVPPGDVDLIAPVGTVDAGDAGIRVSGNLNIAATAVLNASNINVGGQTSGVPTAPVVAAPNIAGLTNASNAAGAANSAAESVANQARQQAAPEESPSIISVDVLGYGGESQSDSGSLAQPEVQAEAAQPGQAAQSTTRSAVQPGTQPTARTKVDADNDDDDDDDSSSR